MCLALPVLLLEGPRYGAAIRRSGELVRGAWLPTLLALLAIAGVSLLLELVAAATAAFTIADESRNGEAVAERVAAALATILWAPFVALGALHIYRERIAAAPRPGPV